MALLDAVRSATNGMHWLSPADAATVELACQYAATIDLAIEHGDPQTVTKALYLGPHLLNVLAALGGTPAGRKALDVKEEARGKLATIRDLRERPAPTKKRSAAG